MSGQSHRVVLNVGLEAWKATYLRSVIAARFLGRNPVLFDTLGSKELDPGLKPAGATYVG
jgi:hypothetical protein